jgi:hypothetical protein
MRRSRPIAVADPITELFAYLSITDSEGGMDSMNDYLPFPRLLSDPIQATSKAGVLALLGLILGLILPGLLYFALGTFS